MGLFSSIGDAVSSGWDDATGLAGSAAHATGAAFHDAVNALGDPESMASKLGHTALDGVGMVPVVGSVAEGVNAGWYAAQGDWADAGMAAASAIPVAGEAADAARLARDGAGLVRGGEEALHAGRAVETLGRDAHEAEEAAHAVTPGAAARIEHGTHGGNEAAFTLTADGRPTHVEGTLRETGSHLDRGRDELRAQDRVRGRTEARADDDAGHVVGHRFMPGQGERNMFPQNFNFNRGAYKTMENEWADWTHAGGEVRFRTDLKGGTAERPDQVVVRYEVTNAEGRAVYDNRVRFSNEAGQRFSRVPSRDMGHYLH